MPGSIISRDECILPCALLIRLKTTAVINESLSFLCDELNRYLRQKLGLTPSDTAVAMFNISHIADTGSGGGVTAPANAFLSLVNIEEDRIVKQQENFVRRESGVAYQSPKLYLNLYVLFSVNDTKYDEALKKLSFIIQFFQYRNVFDPVNNPGLDERIEKLMVDMCSLSFEQLNHLWGTQGGKYMPSVLYKIRQVTINEDVVTSEAGYIREIQLNEKMKKPIS